MGILEKGSKDKKQKLGGSGGPLRESQEALSNLSSFM